MEQFFRLDNIWLWGIFISLLLVAVNWILFHSYSKAQKAKHQTTQLWKYCETKAFQAVTISLMIPLVLALMGGIFKIGNIFEERIQAEQEKRNDIRWECVQLTSKMWNELYGLTCDVRYFQRGIDEEAHILDIYKKLDNFCCSAEDIVNEWHLRFPNLTDSDTGLFLEFINLLLNSTGTVALSIMEGDDEIETSELQDSLGVIQDNIKNIVHHSILIILKDSIDLLRDDFSVEEKEEAKSEIEDRLVNLRYWSDRINLEEKVHNIILPSIKSEVADAFRESAEEMEEWLRENPGVPIREYQEFNDFQAKFYTIPHRDLVYAGRTNYSKEYLRHLADWLGFWSIYQDINDRAKLPATNTAAE